MIGKDTKVSWWIRLGVPLVLVIVWFAAAGIGGPYFGKIADVSSNDPVTFLPESADSTKVNEALPTYRDQQTIPVIAVFETDSGQLTPAQVSSLQDSAAQLQTVDGVQAGVSPAIVSDDKQAALITIPVSTDGDFQEVLPLIRTTLDSAEVPSYKLTGPAAFTGDLQAAFEGIDSTLLLVALSVVFVILLIVYRSPFLPFIVLFTAVAALSAAILIVYYLAKADVIVLNGQVQGILFILVIGAATDYSLLYIARYREELANYKHSFTAALRALRVSLEPVLAAGGTVIIGLLCLLLSDLGSTKALGPVGAIAISLAMLAALTLLPAVLGLVGRRVFWPRIPRYGATKGSHTYEVQHPVWNKIGSFVSKRPRPIWIVTTAVLLVACVGVFQLKADGISQSDLIVGASEARDGQAVLDKHFPSGLGAPAYVLAPAKQQQLVGEQLVSDAGVDSVAITARNSPSGVKPLGPAGQAPAFQAATPKVIDDKVLLQVTLTDAPDSDAATDTIVRLRSNVESSALIGGATAAQYDTNQSALRDQRVLIPVILVAITVVLMVLLRAVIAPIILLATTLVSFGATLGIAAILFNTVWNFPGSDPGVVIFGFVFLVALGIDYNIFLMTRVREETLRLGLQKGTIKALVVTGGVITSAGIVLAATFAALAVIPILFLLQLAFIVAFGVLLDTIIVRSLLVPALTLEIGPKMWWPTKTKR